jgi:putative hydrolase of the HAD superfamily
MSDTKKLDLIQVAKILLEQHAIIFIPKFKLEDYTFKYMTDFAYYHNADNVFCSRRVNIDNMVEIRHKKDKPMLISSYRLVFHEKGGRGIDEPYFELVGRKIESLINITESEFRKVLNNIDNKNETMNMTTDKKLYSERGNIQAVSFDLWGTLIKSNPEYRKKREKYIRLHNGNVDTEHIIKAIKADIDENVEKFGLHYESIDVYRMIHMHCNVMGITPEQLQHECSLMFVETPPVLIDGVKEVLQKLNKAGIKIYLSSNTVLIDGKFLRIVMEKLGILPYFTATYFSNELGVSKPHTQFFQKVHMGAKQIKQNIIHVGDNELTDMVGSTTYGMNAYYLFNDRTVSDFYKELFD